MNDRDVHGPVDTLVIEFPASADGAETARALRDLIDRGTVRLYDLMIVRADDEGTCVEITPGSVTDGLEAFTDFVGMRSDLLGQDDLEALGPVLDPGTLALVLVYENAWAVPFVAAARLEGAELVAGARVTAQQIMDALDAVEATA